MQSPPRPANVESGNAQHDYPNRADVRFSEPVNLPDSPTVAPICACAANMRALVKRCMPPISPMMVAARKVSMPGMVSITL